MKHPALQRSLLALALISWGSVLVYFFYTGRIVKYLAPDFRLISLAGGLGLMVVGIFNLLTCRMAANCGHDHGPEDTHDHESLDLHPLAAVAIMILPVWLCTGWTTDGFSIAALTRKGLNDSPSEAGSLFLSNLLPPLTKEIIEAQHPANSDGYRTFPLMELFFSSADPEMRDLVGGMKVVTEGRLVPDPDKPEQFRLYRLFITCCAADSRPVPIIARFPNGAPEVEPNSWISLSGTITYPDEGKGHEPVLQVDFAKVTDAPMEESFMRGY